MGDHPRPPRSIGAHAARLLRAGRSRFESTRGARLAIEPPKFTGTGWLLRLAVNNGGPSASFEASVIAVDGAAVPPDELPWPVPWRNGDGATRIRIESGGRALLRLARFRPEPRDLVLFEAPGAGERERLHFARSCRDLVLIVRVRRESKTFDHHIRLAFDERDLHQAPVVTLVPATVSVPTPPDAVIESRFADDPLAAEAHHFAQQDNELHRAGSWQAIPYLTQRVARLFDMAAYIQRHLAGRDDAAALTLACGDMSGEYPFFKRVGIARVDAADISEGQREKFLADVYDGQIPVEYKIADVNEIELEPERYDLVYLQHAYHHVEQLEHVADEIAKSLKPGGIFAITDYVGANFLQRSPRQRDLCGAIWRAMPERYRIAGNGRVVRELRIPDKNYLPPYEAVRSQEIRSVLAARFEALEMHCYAGIVVPIFNGFAQRYSDSSEDQEFIRLMWDLDRWLLAAGQIEPDYMKAIFVPRGH